jgi:gas vesicle protein
MGRVGNILAVAITSAAVGALAGILLAPDDGLHTRRKIMKQGKKLIGSVNDHIDEGMETLEDMKDVLQKQLDRVNKKIGELA